MREHILSNVTEWLAIALLQKHNIGCGCAEVERLRLVFGLLLAGGLTEPISMACSHRLLRNVL